MVTHYVAGRTVLWFGKKAIVNETLCGRKPNDVKNATGRKCDVTCKNCLKIMADKGHWRHIS